MWLHPASNYFTTVQCDPPISYTWAPTAIWVSIHWHLLMSDNLDYQTSVSAIRSSPGTCLCSPNKVKVDTTHPWTDLNMQLESKLKAFCQDLHAEWWKDTQDCFLSPQIFLNLDQIHHLCHITHAKPLVTINDLQNNFKWSWMEDYGSCLLCVIHKGISQLAEVCLKWVLNWIQIGPNFAHVQLEFRATWDPVQEFTHGCSQFFLSKVCLKYVSPGSCKSIAPSPAVLCNNCEVLMPILSDCQCVIHAAIRHSYWLRTHYYCQLQHLRLGLSCSLSPSTDSGDSNDSDTSMV